MVISIPAICLKCGAVFNSGIAFAGNASATIEGCTSGPCPNGHMGIIPDGTYKVIDGILRISKGEYGSIQNLQDILSIAREAEYGLREPDDAVDCIAGFLPPESAAAIKQLGRKHPLAAILFVIAIVGTFANTVTSITQAVKSLFPSDPASQIIINNNNTIVNSPAPEERGSGIVPDPSQKRAIGRRKHGESKPDAVNR
jgi:hypothetical protein